MALVALTNADEIAAAFHTMAGRLQQGADILPRHVNWPGPDPGGDLSIYWHPTAHIWALAEEVGGHHPGYWFGFGTQNPINESVLAPDMQLGLYREGTRRHCAGVFARDDEGRIFAMHKGRFQLNLTQITPAAFREAHQDLDTQDVRWPHALANYFVVADVNDPTLLDRVATFVNVVVQYKNVLRQVAREG